MIFQMKLEEKRTMTKAKKQFSPHIFAEWGELFEPLTNEQKAEVLMAITKFPNYEPVNVPIWAFIKSQLNKDYETFIDKCEKNGQISRDYWKSKKSNDIERLPNDTERHPKRITTNEITTNEITKTKTKTKEENEPKKLLLGEFNNVSLSLDEQLKLNELYKDKFDLAIEILSNYIASSGKKYKSHYAVLKRDNWVYEKVMSKQPKKPDVDKLIDMIKEA